jgi:hypothetical protein
MANLGTSNRTALRYVPEVTFGTTPATPALTDIRYTGESLNYAVKTVQSTEIRSDRNIADLVRVGADVSGDIQFELSFLSFEVFLEAVMASSFSAPVANASTMKNGTVLKSFTIQKHYQDLAVPVYQNFIGVRAGALNLDFKTGAILTGSLTLMGLSCSVSTTQIVGATTPANPGVAEEIMNAVTDVIEIKENGAATTMVINSLSVNINNNLRAQDAIGSFGHIGVALGKMDVTGNIEAYFTDLTAYNRFVNGTAFALSFKVQDATTDSYTFIFPKVKFETATVVSGGLDQDIMMKGTWRALYDTATSCTVQIDKYNTP